MIIYTQQVHYLVWVPGLKCDRQSRGVLLMEAESSSQTANDLASFISSLAFSAGGFATPLCFTG